MEQEHYVEDLNEVDKLTLAVADMKLDGAAFVIPLDAPLPNELGGSAVPTGALLDRLAFLGTAEPESGFPFIPVSGPELMALERAWRSLQQRRSVYVLTGLPGAKYDVLFDTAKRAIGLRSAEWDSFREALTARAIEQQRLKDTKPWVEGMRTAVSKAASTRRARDFHRDARVESPVPGDDRGLPNED